MVSIYNARKTCVHIRAATVHYDLRRPVDEVATRIMLVHLEIWLISRSDLYDVPRMKFGYLLGDAYSLKYCCFARDLFAQLCFLTLIHCPALLPPLTLLGIFALVKFLVWFFVVFGSKNTNCHDNFMFYKGHYAKWFPEKKPNFD